MNKEPIGAKQSRIDCQMDMLSKEVSSMEEAIDEVESRLGPVILSEDRGEKEKPGVDETMSPLRSRIHGLHHRVSNLTCKVRGLLEYIEL